MSQQKPRICIIGAGMSGILMGIRLKEAGFEEFTIYEKAASVGGTWRENTYPGLACDVASFVYCYSFEPNPNWTHRFSPGYEIREYFEMVAEKYGVTDHISFNREVSSARHDGDQWRLETKDGGKDVADVLVSACGPLHQPRYPDIEGLDGFNGDCFHSARWDHNVELAGKKIGVVGTGSSAAQMMAPLAKVADRVHMFQRTPQWVVSVPNKRYSKLQKRLMRRFRFLCEFMRWRYRMLYKMFAVAVIKDGWQRRLIGWQCRRNLKTVKDEGLRRKLTPDYQPMCKRLVVSADFYPTLEKKNVELVTAAIDRVDPRGVVTEDGVLRELDVLVLATGFNVHALGVEGLIGQHGRSLRESWDAGTRAYRTLAVPGFPNFFMLIGPNSPVGNISLIEIAETQTDYVTQCIRMFHEGRFATLTPKEEVTRKFNESLVAAMKDTVWVSGCQSWYLDKDGVPATWAWTAERFHQDLREPDLNEFDLRAA